MLLENARFAHYHMINHPANQGTKTNYEEDASFDSVI